MNQRSWLNRALRRAAVFRWSVLICLGVCLSGVTASLPGASAKPPISANGSVEASGKSEGGAGAGARQRLIRWFDFEERQRGNYEELPRHWYVMGRQPKTSDAKFLKVPLHSELVGQPGFPGHTKVRFDESQRVSGQVSFHLGLDGGNAGAFLETGVLAAVPGSDYQITFQLRTADLKMSSARLLAYFIDAQGQRIDASIASSPPMRTDGRWVALTVRLAGDYPQAAWIGLQIELNQPTLSSSEMLGGHEVVYQDIQGSAWFDDIRIWQLPSVSLSTQSLVNVIRWPSKPQVTIKVRDMTSHRLTARLAVWDEHDRLVDRIDLAMPKGRSAPKAWEPGLPGFGWYRLSVLLYDRTGKPQETGGTVQAGGEQGLGAVVGMTSGAFLWLSEEPKLSATQAAMFGVDGSDTPSDQLRLLPLLLKETRLGSTVVSCWDRQTTRDTMNQRQTLLESLIEEMSNQEKRIRLSLDPMPLTMGSSGDIQAAGAVALLAQRGESFGPYLSPILTRFGQQISQWHLSAHDAAAAPNPAILPWLMGRIETRFSSLAPEPKLVIPWRLDQVAHPGLKPYTQLAMTVPTTILPRNIAAHVTDWSQMKQTDRLLFYVDSLPADRITIPRRVDDMTLRLIHSWEAGAQSLTLHHPWVMVPDRPIQWIPDPILGLFSNAAHRLAGRRVVGRLPAGAGIQAIIFDGPRGGMLAAWNETADPSQAVLDMYLGPQPVRVDLWGNRQPVAVEHGRHQVQLTQRPVFIEGIDAPLALFRSGFSLSPAFIESTQQTHQVMLKLTNPWPKAITGVIAIVEPSAWQIEPRRTLFTLAAGQTAAIPLQVRVPVSEVAGDKEMIARVELMADQRYEVDVTTPLAVGLKNVQFEAMLNIESEKEGQPANDVVVTLTIVNRGDQAVSLYAWATLAGFPRQERPIAKLEPGQTAMRRFRFANAFDDLQKNPVRVGLREASGPAMLNRILEYKPAEP